MIALQLVAPPSVSSGGNIKEAQRTWNRRVHGEATLRASASLRKCLGCRCETATRLRKLPASGPQIFAWAPRLGRSESMR